jgi:hypothetical protein
MSRFQLYVTIGLVAISKLILALTPRFEYPELGPWIVEFDKTIHHSAFETAVKDLLTSKADSYEKTHNVLFLKSFKLALHASVVKGMSKKHLESLAGVHNVYPDIQMKKSVYSWGIDRLDQTSLPLDESYSPSYDGSG